MTYIHSNSTMDSKFNHLSHSSHEILHLHNLGHWNSVFFRLMQHLIKSRLIFSAGMLNFLNVILAQQKQGSLDLWDKRDQFIFIWDILSGLNKGHLLCCPWTSIKSREQQRPNRAMPCFTSSSVKKQQRFTEFIYQHQSRANAIKCWWGHVWGSTAESYKGRIV